MEQKRPVILDGSFFYSVYFFLLFFGASTSTAIEGAGALERMTAQANKPSKARPTAQTTS